MSDFEENDDFMCDDEEDYGLVSYLEIVDIENNRNDSMNPVLIGRETFMNI